MTTQQYAFIIEGTSDKVEQAYVVCRAIQVSGYHIYLVETYYGGSLIERPVACNSVGSALKLAEIKMSRYDKDCEWTFATIAHGMDKKAPQDETLRRETGEEE